MNEKGEERRENTNKSKNGTNITTAFGHYMPSLGGIRVLGNLQALNVKGCQDKNGNILVFLVLPSAYQLRQANKQAEQVHAKTLYPEDYTSQWKLYTKDLATQ